MFGKLQADGLGSRKDVEEPRRWQIDIRHAAYEAFLFFHQLEI